MKILTKKQSRKKYIETQIKRSKSKYGYCSVSIEDVINYHKIIGNNISLKNKLADSGPVLCLGTRNGREVDLYRNVFFGSKFERGLLKTFEFKKTTYKSIFPILESLRRSNKNDIRKNSVIGVEINPDAERKDVWIGSFDKMPSSWKNTFNIIYSNSFDHSLYPNKVAKEWIRVIKPGGYLIFCFTDNKNPINTDPVGNIKLKDVINLFPGELVYYCKYGSKNNDSEIIIKIKK